MVQIIQQQPVTRKPRRPTHRWQVRQKPFVLQPICIAPVIPGETMTNALYQARVVSDPIKNSLVGWHAEYYWFYVKHRDLNEPYRTKLQEMQLDMSTDVSTLKVGSANTALYTFAGGMNFVEACLERITEEYFRDEGVAWNAYTIAGLPIAQINQNSWLDSAMLAADMPTGGDLDPTNTDNQTVQQLDQMYQQWEFLRANALVNMSYEDWLKTFGVRPTTVELHKPELLRVSREWAYPSNTVDPATGAPSSALSVVVSDRIDKDRFFKEPGFLFGVSLVRPKVYLAAQTGAAVGLMDRAFRWLPAIMRDEVYTSLVDIVSGAGPVPSVSTGWWIDMRDLLLYGDQFVNFALAGSDGSVVAKPTTGLQWKFPTEADVDGLFVGSPKLLVRQDGVITFNILGSQLDYT